MTQTHALQSVWGILRARHSWQETAALQLVCRDTGRKTTIWVKKCMPALMMRARSACCWFIHQVHPSTEFGHVCVGEHGRTYKGHASEDLAGLCHRLRKRFLDAVSIHHRKNTGVWALLAQAFFSQTECHAFNDSIPAWKACIRTHVSIHIFRHRHTHTHI